MPAAALARRRAEGVLTFPRDPRGEDLGSERKLPSVTHRSRGASMPYSQNTVFVGTGCRAMAHVHQIRSRCERAACIADDRATTRLRSGAERTNGHPGPLTATWLEARLDAWLRDKRRECSVEKCNHTGVSIPECSCRACLTSLISRYAPDLAPPAPRRPPVGGVRPVRAPVSAAAHRHAA